MNTRRGFLLALGAYAGAAPLASFAQQRAAKIPRIGVLAAASSSNHTKEVEALLAGLRELGYADGRNIVIEYRWADGKRDRLPNLAAELVQLKVDVIVTYSGQVTRVAKQATATIPIVFAAAGDPIASGIVSNLARPDANVTGSTFFAVELATKRLELLKEAFPRIRRIAVLLNPATSGRIFLPGMETAAGTLKVELQQFEARGPNDIESAFSAMNKSRVDGVVVNEEAVLNAHAKTIGEIASKQRFPSIGFREIAEGGGLMAYGVDIPAMWHRAAVYIDKILKGAKPGDLPIERATKFEMVINMKTAKTLGITIPQSILVRADKVIE